MKNLFIKLKQETLKILIGWLCLVTIETSGRISLLYANATPEMWNQNKKDILPLFIKGFIADGHVASIICGILLIVGYLCALQKKSFDLWQKISPIFLTISATLVAFITVVNFFYFATYGHYIDTFAFGLFDDDTSAVLTTIIKDYPILKVMMFIFCFIPFSFYIFRYIQRKVNQYKYKNKSISVDSILLMAVIATLILSIRGSLGVFPFKEEDIYISQVRLFNMAIPNGMIALEWAYKNHKKEIVFPQASNEEGKALLTSFFGQDGKTDLKSFVALTKKHSVAEQKPPHVVFVVMESFSQHLLTLDAPNRDLYGSLRRHWNEDFVLSRFISEAHGTAEALHRFFVRSPIDTISQLREQTIPFKTNMFKPYLDKNYKVVFITSGKGAWRNLDRFLQNLGVTEVVDQATLKNLYPDAIQNTWGVPDEYMFKYAQMRLTKAEENNEKVFLMLLSTTFHPPYKSPDRTNHNFVFTKEENERFSKFGRGVKFNKIMEVFYYTNDQLGRFLTAIKENTSLKTKTIIAVTGDHNIRGIGYSLKEEYVLRNAVPFYLYVPKNYQSNIVFDKNRVGSHKDIMPTLYELSLSEVSYYQNGCNLLADHMDPVWCNAGYNPEIFITPKGAYFIDKTTEFYPWKNSNGLLLKMENQTTPKLSMEQWHHWNTFTQIMNWQLNKQIHDFE